MTPTIFIASPDGTIQPQPHAQRPANIVTDPRVQLDHARAKLRPARLAPGATVGTRSRALLDAADCEFADRTLAIRFVTARMRVSLGLPRPH